MTDAKTNPKTNPKTASKTASKAAPETGADAGASPAASLVETTILDLCAQRGAEKTICPTDAAKGVAATKAGSATPPEDWQKWLGDVRRTAVGLARDGRLVIYRKGKPVDPGDFRGVYRLGLPREE